MKNLRIFTVTITFALFAGSGWASTNATLTTLHAFAGPDGSSPQAPLIQGNDGNFYGTTSGGGSNNLGTIFRISPTGVFTSLYQFSGFDGSDPETALVQGGDGNFYGATAQGGTFTNCNCGTIFRMTPDGTLTTLFIFSGDTNGAGPESALLQGPDGNFYGTTINFPAQHVSSGTVFRITSSGIMTTLYNYRAGRFGIPFAAHAGLVEDTDGNFYGSTEFGGTEDSGSIFRIGTDASVSIFFSVEDLNYTGSLPFGTLARGNDGNLYGTMFVGGEFGSGTAFQLTSAGTLTVLHAFNTPGGPGDGMNPYGGVVQGSDGNFYGTTAYQGAFFGGNLFSISSAGTYTVLYDFSGPDGQSPRAALVQGLDGSFYGTSYQGGTNGGGTVFKLSVPLNPPANQISAIQMEGTNVVIAIPSVWPETYQLQYRDSLTDGYWSNIDRAFITNSIGGPQTLTDCGGAFQPQRFYRVHIVP